MVPAFSPFFARTAHGDVDRNGKRRGQPCHGVEDAFPTVTQSQDSALVTARVSPVIVGCGGRRGQSAPVDPQGPYPTTTTKADACLVAAHVTKFRNGAIGHAADEPLATITANSFVKRPGGSAPLGLVEATIRPLTDFDCASCGANNSATWWPTCEWCGHEQTLMVATFATYAQQGGANRSAADPLHTVTASCKDQNCIVTALLSHQYGSNTNGGQGDPARPIKTITTGGHHAVVAAHLIHRGNGEREGQAPRAMDAAKPLGTVVASGQKHAAVYAFMQKFADNGVGYAPGEPLHTVMAGAPRHAVICPHVEQANGSPEGGKPLAGRAIGDPLSTIVGKGCTQRLVTSNLLKLRGTCRDGQPVAAPLHTVSAGGQHLAEVRAFLLKYYGNEEDGHGLEKPLGTVTVQDRFGLVTVRIDGEDYVIVDIGMRMLSPRELFNAQGFPPDYIIDRDTHGVPMTKTSQVARCGNSVCPPLSRALAGANKPNAVRVESVAA